MRYNKGEKMGRVFFFIFFLGCQFLNSAITLGVDRFFEEKFDEKYKNRRIGLVTNQTGVDGQMQSTIDRLSSLNVVALFSPEHGLKGQHYAFDSVNHGEEKKIPVYSLHGQTRRPKPEMLKGIDLLIYDIQTTGVRAYTYETTLFYVMEEAAKHGIEVMVFDRPNPINGLIVDGPMLEEAYRSFIGYINVPYCHGMTIGELARFFNEEYKVGCLLTVIEMKGWKRSMSYRDTGLHWIPSSPNVPEADTPLFCPMTGLLGELHLLNIGIGFTLPFKIVGAPWIQAELFAEKLNAQKLPGIRFHPFHFRPFWGLYKGQDCQGVLLQITNALNYRPLAVQYLILGILKSLYPKEVLERIPESSSTLLFAKANGTNRVYEILVKEKYPAWKLIQLDDAERKKFIEKRKDYLIYHN